MRSEGRKIGTVLSRVCCACDIGNEQRLGFAAAWLSAAGLLPLVDALAMRRPVWIPKVRESRIKPAEGGVA